MLEKSSETIKFFDMFSGIGGFRAGLNRTGGFECIGHCEIDKYANASYKALHNPKESEIYYEDATTIDTDTLPEFDLLCAGFPCQAFSIAGKRQGFLDPRGTLFFEIARVARARKPAYLLLENVPGLLSHDKGRTFAAILHELCELGYSVEWQVLNSKDFGVPQARRRVFVVGYLDAKCSGKVLPLRQANQKTFVQLIGGAQDSRVFAENFDCVLQIKEGTKRGYKEAVPGDSVDLGYPDSNTRRGRIRRLMPRECFRLQGFADEQIDRLLGNISDTQAYKQAGNAVTVNVVHALGLRLKAAHEASVAAARAEQEAS